MAYAAETIISYATAMARQGRRHAVADALDASDLTREA